MMIKTTALILLFGLSPLLSPAGAASTAVIEVNNDLPPVILAGIEAYKQKGPEEAVKTWLKGSSLEGNKDALSQANLLRQVQDYYGDYKSFNVLKTRDISPLTKILYLAINFDKGPLFAKFVVYRSESGWILVSFNFNTKEELVLPPDLDWTK